MTLSFRDPWLRAFFVDDAPSRQVPTGLDQALFRKLQILDDAVTSHDLLVPPGNRFEKLRGKLSGLHSIRVNSQWRLIFKWDGHKGEASNVYLDNHSYR
jgi:toxin HigB-1